MGQMGIYGTPILKHRGEGLVVEVVDGRGVVELLQGVKNGVGREKVAVIARLEEQTAGLTSADLVQASASFSS